MSSSDDSSSDDGGTIDSRRSHNHTSSVQTGAEPSTTESYGNKKKNKVPKNNRLQNVCGTVENNMTDRKKMCKSDFIKSNSDSSLDSDNRLEMSSMKKQKLKKRRNSNSFSNEVHSPVKRNKSNDVCIDESGSSSEDNQPSTSQRKKKRRKIKDHTSTDNNSDECVDRNRSKTCSIDASNVFEETSLQNVQDLESSDEENDVEMNEDEFAAIKKELSEMSFEDRAKLRDRLGIKVYNQIIHGERKQQVDKKMKKTDFKRENKNRPLEISSKKRTSVFRNVIPVKKKIIRDPRFDDLSGEYDEHLFKQSYGFIDDIKTKEKQKLERQLKKEKDDEKKEGINYLLNRMKQQELSEKKKKERHSLEKQWKKKEMQMVHEGKNPFFLKKGDMKKLELAEKYKELQKSGKLDNYLTKKRKKNASKEKKKLPT